MKLYHSSNVRVEKPDIVHSRDFLDFGRGFYLTSLREQAEKYALRFLRRGQEAWLKKSGLLTCIAGVINILLLKSGMKYTEFCVNC